jgi:hypothetical protein
MTKVIKVPGLKQIKEKLSKSKVVFGNDETMNKRSFYRESFGWMTPKIDKD